MTSLAALTDSPSVKKLVTAQQQQATPTATGTTTAASPTSSLSTSALRSSTPAIATTATTAATPSMSTVNQGSAQSNMQKEASTVAQGINSGASGSKAGHGAPPAPQTLASDPAQYWNQANSAINQQEDTARQFGADQIAANQRRAATLSALSGRGLGEGFLSGQTQATISGINNTNQQINQLEAQRQQIYGTEAGQAFQQGQTQQNNAFQLNMQTAQNQAQANAQQLGSQKQTAATNAANSLMASGINVNGSSGPAWNSFKNLIDAVNNASDAASLQAAQQKLNRAMSNLQALRQQNPNAKGEDWNKLVKNAEKAGQFTNT